MKNRFREEEREHHDKPPIRLYSRYPRGRSEFDSDPLRVLRDGASCAAGSGCRGPAARHEAEGEKGGEGLFKNFGTIAVFCGAVSYVWLRLKTKRRSPSSVVQILVKWFDKLHTYAGYGAIVLVAVHGVYFLTQAAVKDDTYTGLAAFALLLSLGVYGFLIRRVKNKHMRKIHFLLATAFAVVACIHAGSSAIMATVCTIAFWGLVLLMERSARPAGERKAA
ncbi:hypothetical protein LJK88_49155 [Paenibacillus sp. P26]|nr:hypothetical protein LJK88_49155 [Paenibacillus sp. P26]